jgi:hypothetical protein
MLLQEGGDDGFALRSVSWNTPDDGFRLSTLYSSIHALMALLGNKSCHNQAEMALSPPRE